MRFKPIIPRVVLTTAGLEKALDRALERTLKSGKAMFEKTTATWRNHTVLFVVEVRDGKGSVGTDHPIYMYVSRGTRPHIIRARGAALVWEQGKYKSSTRPGRIGSRRVGTSRQGTGGVGQAMFRKSVKHPGTAARGFEETVATRMQPLLETNIQAVIDRFAGGG